MRLPIINQLNVMANMIFRFCVVIFVIGLSSVDAANLGPTFKQVQLERFTSLVVEIPPDHGTRFIFPFVLDEKDEYVPFTMDNTNSSVFTSSRKDGRNSFVISVPATAQGSENAQQDLIQEKIALERQKLTQAFALKNTQLEKRAAQLSLANIGYLAMSDPDHSNIKESNTLSLDNGDEIELYVNKTLQYGPFTSLLFEIKNDSVDSNLLIQDVRLFGVNSDAPDVLMDASLKMAKRVKPQSESRGVLTTQQTMEGYDSLKLVLLTNSGEMALTW